MSEAARPQKRIADSRLTLSALMGPQDANGLGNVHGGVIMKMVDEAGALVAMRHAGTIVVTIVVDSMTFLDPILVGILFQSGPKLTWVGATWREAPAESTAKNRLTERPR